MLYFSHAEPKKIKFRLWNDIGATSDSEGAPCVEPKLISTKVQQTLSNLMFLLHKTKTAIPN